MQAVDERDAPTFSPLLGSDLVNLVSSDEWL